MYMACAGRRRGKAPRGKARESDCARCSRARVRLRGRRTARRTALRAFEGTGARGRADHCDVVRILRDRPLVAILLVFRHRALVNRVHRVRRSTIRVLLCRGVVEGRVRRAVALVAVIVVQHLRQATRRGSGLHAVRTKSSWGFQRAARHLGQDHWHSPCDGRLARVGSTPGGTRNPLLLPYVSDQGGARTLSPTLLVFTYKNKALTHLPS